MKKIFLLLIMSVMTMRIYSDGFDCIQGNWCQLSFDESETIYIIIDGYNKLDLYRSDGLQSASEEHIVLVKKHLLESEYDSRPLNQDSKIEEIEVPRWVSLLLTDQMIGMLLAPMVESVLVVIRHGPYHAMRRACISTNMNILG